MRSRVWIVVLGVVAVVALVCAGLYLWLFLIDRVVSASLDYRDLPDGSRADVVALRSVPSLMPWLPRSEVRISERDGRLRSTLGLDAEPREVVLFGAGPELLLVRERSRLHAIEIASGDVLWSRPSPAPPRLFEALDAAVIDERLFITTGTELIALGRSTGRTEWSVARGSFDRPAPFGARQITAGSSVFDAATGAPRPPIGGFSCRTVDSLLTCDEGGCRRRRPDGSEALIAPPLEVYGASCFAGRDGDLLVAMLQLNTSEPDPLRDSVALASLEEIAANDEAVLVAWDADDRMRWARAIAHPDEACMLEDGRLKLLVFRQRGSEPDGALMALTRYYDLATGEHEECVGADACGYFYDDRPGPQPGERGCRPTRAVEDY